MLVEFKTENVMKFEVYTLMKI